MVEAVQRSAGRSATAAALTAFEARQVARLEPAAGAHDEHADVAQHALREQHADHLHQARIAGSEGWWLLLDLLPHTLGIDDAGLELALGRATARRGLLAGPHPQCRRTICGIVDPHGAGETKSEQCPTRPRARMGTTCPDCTPSGLCVYA